MQGIDIRGAKREVGPQAKAVVDRTASLFFKNDAVRLDRKTLSEKDRQRPGVGPSGDAWSQR